MANDSLKKWITANDKNQNILMKKLQDSISTLTSTFNKIKKELEDAKKKIAELDKNSVKKERDELKKKIDELTRKIENMQEEVKKKLHDLQKYFDSEQVLTERYNEQKVKNALGKLKDIKQQLEFVKKAIDKLEDYKLCCEALKDAINKINEMDDKIAAKSDYAIEKNYWKYHLTYTITALI